MKLKVEIEWDDLLDDTKFNLNYQFKQEIIERVIDQIYSKLTVDWENEIVVAVRERMEREVVNVVGASLDNWLVERTDSIISKNLDTIINQLLKNKLSVALSKII